MATSIFYNMGTGRRFPISLLALETYAIHSQSCANEDELFDLFVNVVTDICKVQDPVEDDLTYFIDRLRTIHEESQKESNKPTPKPPVRGFGTAYADYILKLNLDSRVLKMTGYDFEAARKIYCEIDRDDAMKLINDYVEGLMEEGRFRLEASMYGFGNSYKEDSSSGGNGGQTKTHDISTPEGKAALSRLGF